MYLAGAGADDDDGGVPGHGTGSPADFQAIDARKHQVKHQCIPVTALQFAQTCMAISGMLNDITFIAKMHAQKLRNVEVVFDNQYAFIGVHRGPFSRDRRF